MSGGLYIVKSARRIPPRTILLSCRAFQGGEFNFDESKTGLIINNPTIRFNTVNNMFCIHKIQFFVKSFGHERAKERSIIIEIIIKIIIVVSQLGGRMCISMILFHVNNLIYITC